VSSLRHLSGLDRAAVAYAAVYYAWLTARTFGVPVPAVVGDVAFYPLGLAIAWVNWRNSRVDWLDVRTRVAWRLLALAALALWASGTTWSILVALKAPPEVAANVDRVSVVQFALAIAGYLTFPSRPLPRRGGIRFGLDVALIAVAGFVIAFYMGLRLLLKDPAEPATLAVLESSVDWVLFVVAAVGSTQKRDPIIGRVLILLLASNLVSMPANYLQAILPAYQSGHPIDGLWFSAWVLRWTAARLAWHHYTTPGASATPSASPARDYRSNPFAYLLVAAAFLLLLVQVFTGSREFLLMLTVAATGMGALLIVRQFAELEENRRLFEAQVEGESRFRSLVQNSSDVVIVVDDGGVISYVSPSVSAVFTANAYVRPGMPFRQLLGPEASIADALLAGDGDAPPRFEAAMQVAPGRWREVEAAWSDLRSDTAVGGIVITCRDVTDRNEVERHLRQAQKLDAVGHLAGGLAHDLNNVLGIIRGYAELLRSELPEVSAAGRDLDQILKAVDRAAGVTAKVLAFSRKQPGQVQVLDLNAVIGGLAPILRHLMKDQVEVQLDLGRGLWPVRADQGQIEQVVVNLATNARDAMPDGGVISIRTANRAVSGAPEATQPGECVELSVADRGCGVSAELVARIFEPFFSTKPKDQALGLGLSIVHGIVTEAGGRVLVDSEEGRGSTFTVLLPRAR